MDDPQPDATEEEEFVPHSHLWQPKRRTPINTQDPLVLVHQSTAKLPMRFESSKAEDSLPAEQAKQQMRSDRFDQVSSALLESGIFFDSLLDLDAQEELRLTASDVLLKRFVSYPMISLNLFYQRYDIYTPFRLRSLKNKPRVDFVALSGPFGKPGTALRLINLKGMIRHATVRENVQEAADKLVKRHQKRMADTAMELALPGRGGVPALINLFDFYVQQIQLKLQQDVYLFRRAIQRGGQRNRPFLLNSDLRFSVKEIRAAYPLYLPQELLTIAEALKAGPSPYHPFFNTPEHFSDEEVFNKASLEWQRENVEFLITAESPWAQARDQLAAYLGEHIVYGIPYDYVEPFYAELEKLGQPEFGRLVYPLPVDSQTILETVKGFFVHVTTNQKARRSQPSGAASNT